jgi:cyanophycinase-like exopeptidase
MPKAVKNRQMPDVVGMTENEATAALMAAGFTARVMSVDGKSLVGTADFRTDRANLALRDGKVTKVSIG